MDAVELSLPDARRIALRAQGFGGPRSGTNGNLRAVRKVVRTLHYLQMDAVNVLIRAHYLPVFSRVGAYDIGHLDRMAYKRRELFEHRPKGALGLFDVDLHRLFRWSLTPRYEKMWEHALERVEAARPGYVDMVIAEITERGPLAYTELSDPGRIPKDQRRTKYAASSVMWWITGSERFRSRRSSCPSRNSCSPPI